MSGPIEFPAPMRVVSRVLGVTAGVLLFALSALTVADVLGRNLRGQSILGAIEMSTLLLVAVAFFGLAAAELDGRHVAVSLVEERLGRRTRMVLSVVRTVLLLMLGVVLSYAMIGIVGSAVERGETTNDILRLPTWPAKVAVLISFALFFVFATWKEVLMFRALKKGEEVPSSAMEVLVDQTGTPELGESRER